MKSLLATCAIAWFAASIAPAYAEDPLALRLVQTIPVPGVMGRLDHMAVDLERQRLFLAAVANGTLEVLDLGAGKVINSLTGFKDTQPQLNRLYPVLTPPLSMRCSVPRIDWMSGSAAHLKSMTRSRSRTGATSPRTAYFGQN